MVEHSPKILASEENATTTSRLRHHEEFGVLVLFIIPRDAESVVEPPQGTTIHQCRYWGCGKLQASLTGPLRIPENAACSLGLWVWFIAWILFPVKGTIPCMHIV